MSAPTDTPGEPIRRTPADEEADIDLVVKHIMSEKYREWPNEAGFDGLKEERGPIEIKVSGTIPAWAAGSLYRTGPGQFEVSDTVRGPYQISHWFDGLAHTHRFDIVAQGEGVCVLYSSRRQSEALERQIRENGRHEMYSFGQRADPCIGLFGKFMTAWHAAFPKPGRPSAENICVTVQPNHPGLGSISGTKADTTSPALGHRTESLPAAVWLASDTSSYRQMDPATLEPIGFATQVGLHPDLKGQLSCAHAQHDPETGDVYNFNQEIGRETVYRVFRVGAATGATEVIAAIQGPDVNPAYIHSFFMSPSFAVLCVPSSHIAWRGIKLAWERNVLDAIKPFDPAAACKWYVVDRKRDSGVVAEFDTPAAFFFHTVNAFEEIDARDAADGTVSLFLDVVQYATSDVLHALYHDTLTMKDGGAQRYWNSEERVRASNTVLVRRRVRVPVASRQASPAAATTTSTSSHDESKAIPRLHPETVASIPGPHSGELPTINPEYTTRRNRYCYGLASRGLSTLSDTIAKTDLDTGEALLWHNPPGHTPGEAIFVGRPAGDGDEDRDRDEDDGVLLSVVLDGDKAASYLLCLDAKTMREVGRAEVGFAIGLGFHGAHTRGENARA